MKNKIFELFSRFSRSKKGRIDTNTELGSMSVLEEVMETFSNVEIGTVFTTKEIKEMVSKKYGRNERSIIPSDYSYNMTNKGIIGTSCEHFNIFVQTKHGEYEYVGLDYNGNNRTVNTTEIGYVNKNNQRNNGRRSKSDNHYNQWFYELECLNCGHKYNANGSDIWLRKCPNCQARTSEKHKGHKTAREIPDGLRYKVLKRDNFKCCACGASPAKDPSVEPSSARITSMGRHVCLQTESR